MAETPQTQTPLKPVTDTKIPGTDVPDISQADARTEREKQWMSRVAVSTAVMAAIAAIGSSFGNGHLNEAMFQQIREADQWAFYQAKGIKEAILESRLETATAMGQISSEADIAKLKKYAEDRAAIKKEAEACRTLSEDHMKRYRHMSRAATAAQIGIALAAVALLLRKNSFWAMALLGGAIAAAFLTIGLLAS